MASHRIVDRAARRRPDHDDGFAGMCGPRRQPNGGEVDLTARGFRPILRNDQLGARGRRVGRRIRRRTRLRMQHRQVALRLLDRRRPRPGHRSRPVRPDDEHHHDGHRDRRHDQSDERADAPPLRPAVRPTRCLDAARRGRVTVAPLDGRGHDGAIEPLQRVSTGRPEPVHAAGLDQRSHDVGHQDRTRRCRGTEASRLVHGGSEPVVVLHRGLAHADPDPQLDRGASARIDDLADRPLHGDRARHRVGGTAREGDHEPVAQVLDLDAPGLGDRRPERSEERPPNLVSGRVAQLLVQFGRPDEIAEQERRCRRRHHPRSPLGWDDLIRADLWWFTDPTGRVPPEVWRSSLTSFGDRRPAAWP